MEEERKGFHGHFTRRLLVPLLAGLAVSNALFYLLVSRPLGKTYQAAFHTLSQASGSAAGYLIRIDIYAAVILAALIFFVSLLMSHRISGPVYRFEKTAEALAGGDFSQGVRLREKDELKDAAAQMDASVRELRNRLRELKDLSREAARTAGSIEGSRDGAMAAGKAADLRLKAGEIRERLGYFKF